MLTLYQNGQPIDSMKVITGTEELPTPLIASVMYYITYNPYWHAPDHLVRKTIAPNVVQARPGLFQVARLRRDRRVERERDGDRPKSIDWKAAAAGTLHLKIRQDPGPLNSMGILKFPFPEPARHLSPRHARPCEVRIGRTATSATAACGSRMRSGSAAGCSVRAGLAGQGRRNPGPAAARHAGLSDLHHGAGERTASWHICPTFTAGTAPRRNSLRTKSSATRPVVPARRVAASPR